MRRISMRGTTEEYWQDKISKDTMVYMMFENIVLSFDYFLYQEKRYLISINAGRIQK